jgi:transposase
VSLRDTRWRALLTALSDEEFACLARHLARASLVAALSGTPARGPGRPLVFRIGCPPRCLRRRYPPRHSVYCPLRRWRLDSTCERLKARCPAARRTVAVVQHSPKPRGERIALGAFSDGRPFLWPHFPPQRAVFRGVLPELLLLARTLGWFDRVVGCRRATPGAARPANRAPTTLSPDSSPGHWRRADILSPFLENPPLP